MVCYTQLMHSTLPLKYVWLSLALLLLSLLLGLSFGAFNASVGDSLRALVSKVGNLRVGVPTEGLTVDKDLADLMLYIRLPRVLGAALIGAALAAAGSSFQALFRNPLVSPDILGVSSGAALGAVIAMLMQLDSTLIQIFAFAAGLATVFIVSALGASSQKMPLLLAGVVISALMAAMVSAVQVLAPSSSVLPGIVFWLLGSLGNLTLLQVLLLFIAYCVGLGILLAQSNHIDKCSLGDTTAQTLGVNLQSTRLWVIIAATLMTASTVAVAGIIGWVGLVVPHITRRTIGASMKANLIIGSLFGAAFMALMDTLSRSLFVIEIPIGIVTAVIGVPIFLIAILRSKHNV